MTLAAQLKKIKNISYKVAGISEKLVMIEELLVNEKSLHKWWVANMVFDRTRMSKSVLSCDVKYQLQYHFNTVDCTLSAKADAISSLIDNYESFVDVDSLIKEVFGDSYPTVMEQIRQNKVEQEEFQKRIQTMPPNATMTDVCALLVQVQEDMKEI